MKLNVKRQNWIVGRGQSKLNETKQTFDLVSNGKGKIVIASNNYEKQVKKGFFKKRIFNTYVSEEIFSIIVTKIGEKNIEFKVDKATDLEPINVNKSSNYTLNVGEEIKFETQTEDAGTTFGLSLSL